jgi:Tfp pilus assembly protein FimT
MAIASTSWLDAIESRKVDTATNQVAADLRYAHSQATNRLADSFFTYQDPTPPVGIDPLLTYEVGPAGAVASDRLPEGTRISATPTKIKFKAAGTAEVVSGPAAADGFITVTVRSSEDAANNHAIEINTATSRIRVVP